MFKGSYPALLTPFTADGRVDEDAFAAHVEWQISEGSHGLVPVGTTGEIADAVACRAQACGRALHRSGAPVACR